MIQSFTAHFAVRQYELNSHGEMPNSSLQRLFQETATLASADAGYGVEWYATHRNAWVIFEMTLEHLGPIHYLDELSITTWVSDLQRVRSHREYLARNAKSGESVARGRAFWAFLNRDTLFPARISPDFIERFSPNGIRAVPRITPRAYPAPHFEFPEFRMPRHVHRYEADEMKHVNNAIYLDWLEEALYESTGGLSDSSWELYVRRHDITYTRAAMPGDDVVISVYLEGAGQSASAWRLEIKRGEELLVRDRVTALWIDGNGQPARWKRE
jgi:acyl-CoA thioester hydrolase